MSYDQNPLPFLKRLGGKRRLLPKFEEMELYPDGWLEDESRTLFVPFMGGGSATLRYAQRAPGRSREVYAQDADWELVNCFKALRDDLKEFFEYLGILKEGDSEDYYYTIRSHDRRKGWLDEVGEVARAARYFYINKTGFNGLWRTNRKGQCNVPWGKRAFTYDTEHLTAVSNYLAEQHIDIEHVKVGGGDWGRNTWEEQSELISHGDFVLMDPPYVPMDGFEDSFVGYTVDGFSVADTKNLLEYMGELRGVGIPAMMTNHGPEWLIREANERGFHVTPYAAGRSVSRNGDGRQKVPEIAITNYKPPGAKG